METTKMKIKNEEYEVREDFLDQSILQFYKDNPRIYSVVNIDDEDPTQEEIEKKMCSLEHVKELKSSIVKFGGLAEPVIVKDGTFEVLEGNSRLAAYRLLNKAEPNGRFQKIRCRILPVNISEEAIRALLGTLHLVGRTDWSPFEQAGYLYRIKHTTNNSVEEIAHDLGLKTSDVRSYIDCYTLMIEKDDILPDHWSYYYEYLKSKSINKKRKEIPELDDVFSAQVKGNRIKAAIDVRNVFSKAVAVKDKKVDKALERFIDPEQNFDIYDVMEEVEQTGKTEDIYKFLNKFRNKIVEKEVFDEIVEKGDAQVAYEIRKIYNQIEKIKNRLEKKGIN